MLTQPNRGHEQSNSSHAAAVQESNGDKRTRTELRKYSHSGPLPDPITLSNYDKIVPGAAERILAMAEKEQAHRHGCDEQRNAGNQKIIAIEDRRQGGIYKAEARGQFFGFIVSLVALGCALYAANLGVTPVAIAFLSLPLMSVVRAFIVGKQSKASDESAAEVKQKSEAPAVVSKRRKSRK